MLSVEIRKDTCKRALELVHGTTCPVGHGWNKYIYAYHKAFYIANMWSKKNLIITHSTYFVICQTG